MFVWEKNCSQKQTIFKLKQRIAQFKHCCQIAQNCITKYNLENRLLAHNSNKGAKSTKGYKWELVFKKKFFLKH